MHIYLDSNTLVNQFDRQYHSYARSVAEHDAGQSGQGAGLDPNVLSNRQLTVRLHALQVQAGAEGFDFSFVEFRRTAAGPDECDDPGHIQDWYALLFVDFYKEISRKQREFQLGLAAVLPTMDSSI